jgi:hypothetical protein
VAAVGALAGYALKQKNKKEETVVIEERGRSRSRVRDYSPAGSYDELPPDERHNSAANPEHSKRRIAQAGLASAAVAGLVERARSKSRQRKGEKARSKSRIRQGVPIAAAGLGGAALAGLYEKNKGKKEEREYEERVERSRSRSRPRSRSVPYDDRRRATSDPALIEYGGDPIMPDRADDHRYGARDPYDDPADYRRRRRGSSASSSPGGGRRDRSRSRTRRAAETAAVAGAAGLAASKATQRHERKKADRERRRKYHPTPMMGELLFT